MHVMNSGGITDSNGRLLLISTIYKSNCAVDVGELNYDPEILFDTGRFSNETLGDFNTTAPQLGYCPSEGEGTEPHIVVGDHGPVANSPKDVLAQLTNSVSPLCSSEGGPNLCLGVGGTGIGPITEDGVFDMPINNMKNFPSGCADAGTCDAVEESLQLGSGGTSVTFITTGDAIQVLVNIQIDHLPEGYFSD